MTTPQDDILRTQFLHEQKQTGVWDLTKREWFAGMALQGMIDSDADVDPEFVGTMGKWGDVVAKRAYQYADAVIRAGKKDSPCQTTGVVGK